MNIHIYICVFANRESRTNYKTIASIRKIYCTYIYVCIYVYRNEGKWDGWITIKKLMRKNLTEGGIEANESGSAVPYEKLK